MSDSIIIPQTIVQTTSIGGVDHIEVATAGTQGPRGIRGRRGKRGHVGGFPTISSPLSYDLDTTNLSLPKASSSQDGYISANDWITFNNKQDAAPAFSANQILFGSDSAALSQDSKLFWDNINKRLGIGNSSPQFTADVTSGDGYNATYSMYPIARFANPNASSNPIIFGIGSNGAPQIYMGASNPLTLNALSGLSSPGFVNQNAYGFNFNTSGGKSVFNDSVSGGSITLNGFKVQYNDEHYFKFNGGNIDIATYQGQNIRFGEAVIGDSSFIPRMQLINGNWGVDTAPANKFHILAAAEQLRLAYDANNYSSFTADASGNLNIAPNPTTGKINFTNTGGLNIYGGLNLNGATPATATALDIPGGGIFVPCTLRLRPTTLSPYPSYDGDIYRTSTSLYIKMGTTSVELTNQGDKKQSNTYAAGTLNPAKNTFNTLVYAGSGFDSNTNVNLPNTTTGAATELYILNTTQNTPYSFTFGVPVADPSGNPITTIPPNRLMRLVCSNKGNYIPLTYFTDYIPRNPPYSIANDSTNRSLDISNVTLTQLANVVATMYRDLILAGGLN